jgi:hypothetical protein
MEFMFGLAIALVMSDANFVVVNLVVDNVVVV